jgi:threonine dehydratase
MLHYSDIVAARRAIEPYLHRTPMIRSKTLSDLWGANIYLKLECWQKTGSFKPRGAFNKLLTLSEAERAAGVVGVSGGNHAQGLAFAAKVLGISSLICMPESTPQNYLSATRDYGAEIRLFPDIHTAFKAAELIQAEGRVYVHPFDDPSVAAGQGTLGLEIAEEVPKLSRLFVSIGGGALIGGIATALKESPKAPGDALPRIIGVETEGADVMARTIAAGRLVTLPAITSIARTLGSPSASPLTFDLASRLVDDFLVVSDAEALDQLFFLLERAKILVEPAAACCLAAAARQAHQFQPDENIVILLCGGNVSIDDLCAWHRNFHEPE